MSKSAKRFASKTTRGLKIERGADVTRKDKFDAPVTEEITSQPQMPKFEAASQNQKLALAYLREGRQVVGMFGSAGTGKSLVAAYWASQLLKQKKVDKIILLRPNVHCGKSIGLLTGNEDEKLAPFFVQTIQHLKRFMGNAFVTYCQNKDIIQTKAFEFIRGMSFENTVVIAEEVQTLTDEEFETLLTRIGTGCQMIMTGDSRQVNRGQESGLNSTFAMIEKAVEQQPDYLDEADLDALEDNFGIVRFTPDDIVRSGVVRALVKLYYYKK